jgi:tRNA A-37 threonylcarbamoyl transferase component Bud32
MSDSPLPTCPRCGAPLPADAPEGLCPRCLGALPLEAETILDGGPSGPAQPLSPEELAPHFPQLEILECLGRGGMGVVYKARQKTLNRLVALKLLAPERVDDEKFAERFAREAQALAALNHPSIVTIHDFGQAGGFYFLLMEFVDGANLRQLMGTQKFTPEEALAIVPAICEALQYAHERGIVHRDIKPENILLDKAGRVKIADFGVARMLNVEGPEASLAETQPAGTPQYMAPEQKEHRRTDHRADIYSLGVVFYEMLTGELPGKPLEAPSSRLRGMQVEVRLDEIVLRALEANPERRYQTANEFRVEAETIAAGPPPHQPPLEHKLLHLEGVTTFRSVRALRVAQVACIGFLGFLGYLPRWHAFFGFFGFFGLIGVAYVIEAIARRKSASPEVPLQQPRPDGPGGFSRAALIAAGWITLCVVVVPPFIWHENRTHEFEYGGLFSNFLSVFVFLVFLLPAITAPFGATLLGWVAVSQIRRSAGKLHGLWLAVSDGLFFPLLIVDAIAGGLCFLIVKVVVILLHHHTGSGSSMDGLELELVCWIFWFLLTLVTSGWLDYLIIRYARHAVNADSQSQPAHGTATHDPRAGRRVATVTGIAFLILLIVALSIFHSRSRHRARPAVADSSVPDVTSGSNAAAGDAVALQSKRQRFEPTEGMADKTSWEVHDKPSIYNPNGWAIVTRMTLGGEARARLPGENDDFCRIKLTDGNDDQVTLDVDDLKANNSVTITLKRDQWTQLRVNGVGYNIGYPAVWVAADQPDSAPFAFIVVTRSGSPAATSARGNAPDNNPEVLNIQLQLAEDELLQKEQAFNAGVLSQGDLDAAKEKVESLTAQLTSDPVRIAKVNLASAQLRLDDADKLRKAGLITELDYQKIKDEVAIDEAKLREAEANSASAIASPAPASSPAPPPL